MIPRTHSTLASSSNYMMSYKWKPIITVGCVLLYRWAARPLKVLSRLKNNVSSFSVQKEWDENKRSSTGTRTECQRRKKMRGTKKRKNRQTERESEKEKTQKCGPPGLDADTGEGLLRGGARPYGCMAKWNPRGGSGHISLHGALHRFLCTAVCGTHRNIDNDIRLSHLCDGSWIPADTTGERPGGEKSPAPPREHTVTYATQ